MVMQLSEKRILLVEDEPEIQVVLAEALRGKSYAVDFAATVREAKTCLAAQTYDLVITDWKLPDGDGRLIADWATELGAKTVVMSGYLSRMPGGRAPGHETLMKPIRIPEFVDLVRRSLA
ncbi:MAG: response regulator [Alphaproteobacteria bacterium]